MWTLNLLRDFWNYLVCTRVFHKSNCDTPTFEQCKRMSNELSEFFDPAGGNDKAVTVPQKTVLSSSSQSQSVATSTVNYSFQSIQDGSQNLVHGFIPGATFRNCDLWRKQQQIKQYTKMA